MGSQFVFSRPRLDSGLHCTVRLIRIQLFNGGDTLSSKHRTCKHCVRPGDLRRQRHHPTKPFLRWQRFVNRDASFSPRYLLSCFTSTWKRTAARKKRAGGRMNGIAENRSVLRFSLLIELICFQRQSARRKKGQERQPAKWIVQT